MLTRRALVLGLIAAPAVIRTAGLLMPIRAFNVPIPIVWGRADWQVVEVNQLWGMNETPLISPLRVILRRAIDHDRGIPSRDGYEYIGGTLRNAPPLEIGDYVRLPDGIYDGWST